MTDFAPKSETRSNWKVVIWLEAGRPDPATNNPSRSQRRVRSLSPALNADTLVGRQRTWVDTPQTQTLPKHSRLPWCILGARPPTWERERRPVETATMCWSRLQGVE